MLSMTGYSSLTKKLGPMLLQIDIKAVNSKYTDLRLNASFCDNNYLERLRKQILEKIGRGQVTVDMTLRREQESGEEYDLNVHQLERYVAAYEAQFGAIGREISALQPFFVLPNVTQKAENIFDPERDGDFVHEALDEALAQFYAARAEEGARLKNDLLQKVAVLAGARETIAARVPDLDQQYVMRLQTRMQEFIETLDEIDEARILNEVAIQAVKSTIDEELVRLASHLEKLTALIESEDAFIGKRIDFYMQEMNREFNTIASKVSDVDVAETVVTCKLVVDQIREQTQNIV
ncbi:MAG: YicC/YloC family endoribonuclease [Peptococcaceae bacterium]|nr:YicC/YloC family endoribonuclease [Peptococcaceae bacterium]